MLRAFAFVGTLCVATSCASQLASGDFGTLRFAGRVKGTAPLRLLPPVSDASGNVYVLNGAANVPETHTFVGFVGGGWSAECNLTKGDVFGAHGWAGFAKDRQWYWSGSGLVAVSGKDGKCHLVLDKDRSTNADLLFQAVLPAVRNLSERTTLVALVQSPGDVAPFSALVDLDAEFLTNVRAFEPAGAENVAVIGVGGDRESARGVALVQYTDAGRARLELRSFDGDANPTDRVGVSGGPFAPYAVEGYLQIASDGLVAGLVSESGPDAKKVLLTVDDGGGSVIPIDKMDPLGVHLWDGELWLVGVANDKPVIAPIARGRIGSVTTWDASLELARALGGAIEVRDDRSLPSRTTTWTSVRTAIGPFPFLGPHALTRRAPGTTLWLYAGPVNEGNVQLTSFAMGPTGVSYP